jgi:hypothetical protein
MAKLKALLETKEEYLAHFGDLLSDAFIVEVADIYKSARESSQVLKNFQDGLANIGSWNAFQISQMYERVKKHTQCDYFQDLVKSLLIVYVKIHMLTHSITDAGDIKIRVPSNENFIHRCLVAVARGVWKRPYLFYHNVRSIERRANMNDVDIMIRKCFTSVVRSFLPFDELLQKSALVPDKGPVTPSEDDDDDDESEEESESESESESGEEEEEEDEETAAVEEEEEEEEDEEEEDEDDETESASYNEDDTIVVREAEEKEGDAFSHQSPDNDDDLIDVPILEMVPTKPLAIIAEEQPEKELEVPIVVEDTPNLQVEVEVPSAVEAPVPVLEMEPVPIEGIVQEIVVKVEELEDDPDVKTINVDEEPEESSTSVFPPATFDPDVKSINVVNVPPASNKSGKSVHIPKHHSRKPDAFF